jgi:hypothetical protein
MCKNRETCNSSSSMKGDNNNLIQEVIKTSIVFTEFDALPIMMSLCPYELYKKSHQMLLSI